MPTAIQHAEAGSTAGPARPWIDRSALRADGILAAVTVGMLAIPSLLLMVVMVDGAQWLLSLVVTLAIAGAILLRRTRPVLALGGLTLLAAGHVALHAWMFPVWFGVLVVLYSVGRFSRWPGRLIGFGLALIASLLAAYWFVVETSIGPVDTGLGMLSAISLLWIPPMLLFSVAILTGWGVAAVARSTAATEVAQVSLRRADQEEERAALARDMHDVVAHSLAVVIAQANGARYTADPAAKDASLESIAGTAKEALGDVRLLLAQLRHREAPDPVASLAGADALIERMREAGLDVRLERAGVPVPLPRTADIAAYRILQEALTNALRHGDRGQPVLVRLRGVGLPGGTGGIVVDVHNRVLPSLGQQGPGQPGHGVRGMHERARLAGGEAWTGIEQGWFRVRAAFPAGLT
ncbi:sensor histidine kinase [Agrococcus baldri]|uniref:histidine kinase n=1 Tax=Agrococcus baldri TaxID=153730 RepID=A0AA87RFF6_9MICO|nr:histidine kinase [Agrococcus baldri]GEK78663.1 two-component sensor histidine kinase [Agrococcus baldri]